VPLTFQHIVGIDASSGHGAEWKEMLASTPEQYGALATSVRGTLSPDALCCGCETLPTHVDRVLCLQHSTGEIP
jgi:hypothetical protein